MKDLYPIYKKQYAMKLREMGNPIIDAASNERNPKFVVYFFEKNKKLLQDLEIITNSK